MVDHLEAKETKNRENCFPFWETPIFPEKKPDIPRGWAPKWKNNELVPCCQVMMTSWGPTFLLGKRSHALRPQVTVAHLCTFAKTEDGL
jgi:hypothetical protein